MTDLEDNQLVACVARGEEWAFLALYDRYVGRVHALTLRILGEGSVLACYGRRPTSPISRNPFRQHKS